jgi:hypothetical protein
MQIPASAITASISAITTGKAERTAATEAPTTQAPHVEGSEQSNPDRDAQGQGDGMGPRGNGKHRKDALPTSEVAATQDLSLPAPTLPDEPPSQLDMLG